MKKFFVSLLMIATVASALISEAEAKRMGGSRSVGRQSSMANRQSHAPAPPTVIPHPSQTPQPPQAPVPAPNATRPLPPQAAPQPVPARPASPWGGFLGGALTGLGLGALMSHFGTGNGMGGMHDADAGTGIFGSFLTLILLVVVAVVAVRLLRRKRY